MGRLDRYFWPITITIISSFELDWRCEVIHKFDSVYAGLVDMNMVSCPVGTPPNVTLEQLEWVSKEFKLAFNRRGGWELPFVEPN